MVNFGLQQTSRDQADSAPGKQGDQLILWKRRQSFANDRSAQNSRAKKEIIYRLPHELLGQLWRPIA